MNVLSEVEWLDCGVWRVAIECKLVGLDIYLSECSKVLSMVVLMF